EPRAKISRGGLAWALHAVVLGHMSMARVAASLGVSWNTANTAILAEVKRVLFEDEHRFEGVAVIGVDDAPARCALYGGTPIAWRHTRKGDKYVTVIIDLT